MVLNLMDHFCSLRILLKQGMNPRDIRAIPLSPLSQIKRDHRLQAMLGPKEKVIYDAAELNGVPDLGDVALPYTDHVLSFC